MHIKYGNINTDVVWQWPTRDIFESWSYEFLSIPGAEKFQIFLIGGFKEAMDGKRDNTPDVDIILTGEKNLVLIENLIHQGIKLGIEKYSVFFDVLWFDQLPIYSNLKPGETVKIKALMPSNKWIVDGEIVKEYKSAKSINANLWEVEFELPTKKQRELITKGYLYSKPEMLIKHI